MRNILCFGDSNIHGCKPGFYGRYDYEDRWTGILQELLGNEYRVIENGVGGRTIDCHNPNDKFRNSIDYIELAIRTSVPVDYLIIGLGGNDLSVEYNKSPKDVIADMKHLINKAKKCCRVYDEKQIEPILIFLAAPIIEVSRIDSIRKMTGGPEEIKKAQQIAIEYNNYLKEYSKEINGYYIPTDELNMTESDDGVHFTKNQNRIIAEKLYNCLKTIK